MNLVDVVCARGRLLNEKSRCGWREAAFGGSSRPVLLAVPASRDEFRNADQIVGDQIEQEVPGGVTNAAMPGLSKGAFGAKLHGRLSSFQ